MRKGSKDHIFEKNKSTILKMYNNNKSYTEIANRVGVSSVTVKKWIREKFDFTVISNKNKKVNKEAITQKEYGCTTGYDLAYKVFTRRKEAPPCFGVNLN